MRALWVCTEAGNATAVLAQMVHQVSLAAAISQYGGALYKCKRRRLSRDELDVARGLFNAFDLNGNGTLEIAELYNLLKSMGFNPKFDQVQALLDSVDYDRSGELDHKEFVRLLETIPGLEIHLKPSDGLEGLNPAGAAAIMPSDFRRKSISPDVSRIGCVELE